MTLDKQHAFDSYCKKALKYKARDYYRAIKRRGEHETVFSDLSERELADLAVTDNYFADEYAFDVPGEQISVTDNELAEALNQLPADRREIILLAFFLGMKDREIAERMDKKRRTVAYQRTSSLKKLKKLMEEDADE